jgi:DNA-binding CsgD family transcriptional regulator
MNSLWLIGLPTLYATFVLGYVVATGLSAGNHHLRTFMAVYILFCVEKFGGVAEWLLRFLDAGSPGMFVAIRVVDKVAVLTMFLLLLSFVRSFYGVVSIRMVIVFLLCFFADWIVRLFGTFLPVPPQNSWFVFLDNVSIVPLLLWILYIGLKGSRGIRGAEMRRLFALTMLIIASIGLIILADGLLEAFASVDLPKDPLTVFVYATLALLYLARFRNHLSGITEDPVGAFGDEYALTKREREIVSLLLKGHSYVEIGRLLYISLATVKTHSHNIYTKTGLSSRYELMNAIR